MSAPGPYRLKSTANAVPVEFRFDGKVLHGIEGDTVASALLANGVRVVSRSFKFHRPRGIFSAGVEEPNALIQLHSGARAIPCARATLIPISPGLEVSSEVGWPSLSHDALRAIDVAHSIFAAGFYNKTFMWPSWHVYEPIIRKLAGFGRAPTGPDPDRYETRHAHCDVLVVGGGVAGVHAARTAAAAGQSVILVEQRESFGSDVSSIPNLANVQALTRTVAVAYYDHDLVTLAQTVGGDADHGADAPHAPRERLWLVRASRVVLATGVLEQPLIFSNNDRPGIMLAGAALTYLRRHGIAPGRSVVIATNNDSAYLVAHELRRAGVNIVALVDSRESPPAEYLKEMRALEIAVLTGSLPVDTQGFGALKRVTIGTLSSNRKVTGLCQRACDALLVSGGFSPTLHLFAQAGGKLKFSDTSRTFEPVGLHPSIEIVGSAAQSPPGHLGERQSPIGNTARQWLDLRHDVTVADIELSVRENFTAVEHIKRYTTLGMSVDQGKLGQAPATEVIARARGLRPSELGHTTFRPPFVPVTLGTMVGRNVGALYAPNRRTPLYALQSAAGALFEDFGEWQRAEAFPRTGESREQATAREVKLVRNGVGLYDASSLGKIELIGPDALEFADRFYINNLKTLKPGRARYGLMLRETGIIFDDGTVVVLDDDRVLLTTTSSGAGRVAQWLEEWRQCEWPGSQVIVAPVTDQWATIALTGQYARAILERLKPECALTNDALPHLGFRATKLLGSESRIYRVSFSGELTYEINVPSHKGPQLWAALLDEGRSFGIEPFGVDALLHLRMEKGFLHVGADTDGTTVPDDVGFGKPAASKQSHYIGKRSLNLPENTRPDRLQLIGLTGVDAAALPVGSHLRLPRSQESTDGWITSAGALSTDGTSIAMAVLRAGRNQTGQIVTVHDAGAVVTSARVVAPLFYDPSGARMNA
jgi:sarcosine oxidase subunit alpha